MSRAVLVLGVAGAAALAVAVSSRANRPIGSSGHSRVALIGDSYAEGLGPILAKLAAADGVPFRFEGHVSTRAEQWAKGAKAAGGGAPWLVGFEPTHLLVSLGANDVAAAPAAVRRYYEAMRDRASALRAVLVWLHPPKFSAQTGAIYRVIDALGVEVFHTEDLELPLGGIHPTAAGYGTWARAIWADLRSGLGVYA